MRILVLFFLLIFGVKSFSQSYFRKVIGGLGEDYGNTVVLTDDNGFLIGGSSSSYSISNSDAIIFKLDSVGNTQWFKIYGGSQQESAKYMIKDFDGNFVFTGYTSSFGNGSYDVYLVKINSNGDTLFTKSFGGIDWEEGNHILQLQDSSYLITGYTFSFGAGAKDGYILKVSKEGNLIWDKTFGYQNNEEIYEALELKNDSSVIFVGYTNSIGNGLNDGWAVKIDIDGNQEWETTLGEDFNDEFRSVLKSYDGNYIIYGNSKSRSTNKDKWYVTHNYINTLGEPYSYIIEDGENANAFLSRVILGNDSTYVLTGFTDKFGGGKNDMFCVIYNRYVAYQSGPTMGEQENEIGNDLKITHDKGYILVGTTNSFGEKGYQNIYVVKNDSTNYSPRYSEEITVNIKEERNKNFNIYPNPFSDFFVIKSELINQNTEFELYDLSGKKVYNYSFQLSNNQCTIKTNNLENGIYFLKINYSDQNYSFSKLILNK